MILRRVAQSIRRQDWFAVALEFVLVILGVYLGMTVSEAARSRTSRAELHRTLRALHAQLSEDLDTIDHAIEQHEKGREAHARAIAVLSESQVDLEAFDDASTNLMAYNLSFWPNSSAYRMLRDTGRLADIDEMGCQLLVTDLFERAYERQAGIADDMDDAAKTYRRVRDESWDRVGNRFLTEEPADVIRIRNAVVLVRNHSAFYRRYLEKTVRPRLVEAIASLDAYLERHGG
ncbi:MAG: hypothetical protein JRI55_10725 [Deltaproteobacteria bacterium]|nr:hypothetical protein [Deltaproteobacteria bacterium]